MTEGKSGVAILGIFVADLAFRARRMPGMGETIAGSGFKMGPGGKGSNQSVAAARAGARVTFISRIGEDAFGEIALATWDKEGITARVVASADAPTGAAFIYVNDETGDNAIIVVPGAAASISPADVEAAADAIRGAAVFVTQLEQPVAAARRGLEIAREAGVITVFNPAPAEPFDDALYALCDFVTPNETEAAFLTGLPVDTVEEARKAGDVFLDKGVGAALITLGEAGGRAGGRDDRRRRRLQWRLRRRPGAGRPRHRSRPLRLRPRRHLGDARRHSAVDADAGGGREAPRHPRLIRPRRLQAGGPPRSVSAARRRRRAATPPALPPPHLGGAPRAATGLRAAR